MTLQRLRNNNVAKHAEETKAADGYFFLEGDFLQRAYQRGSKKTLSKHFHFLLNYSFMQPFPFFPSPLLCRHIGDYGAKSFKNIYLKVL